MFKKSPGYALKFTSLHFLSQINQYINRTQFFKKSKLFLITAKYFKKIYKETISYMGNITSHDSFLKIILIKKMKDFFFLQNKEE